MVITLTFQMNFRWIEYLLLHKNVILQTCWSSWLPAFYLVSFVPLRRSIFDDLEIALERDVIIKVIIAGMQRAGVAGVGTIADQHETPWYRARHVSEILWKQLCITGGIHRVANVSGGGNGVADGRCVIRQRWKNRIVSDRDIDIMGSGNASRDFSDRVGKTLRRQTKCSRPGMLSHFPD